MGIVRGTHIERTCYRAIRPREWRYWIARCKRILPLSKPVRALLEASAPDLIGECWDDGPAYEIRVDPLLDHIHVADTLLHEWAHLSYYEDFPERFNAHDDGYWVRFGVLYRGIFPSEDDE